MTLESCKKIFESLETNTNITVQEIINACTNGNVTAEASVNLFGGFLLGFLVFLGITLVLLLIAGIYIYTSLAWYTIAKKLKYKRPWFAWIPFANWAMILQLGGFNWLWIFLLLIPIIGWIVIFILLIISRWTIFEKRKFPGWFSLAPIIPRIGFILHMIAIGIVAWKKK